MASSAPMARACLSASLPGIRTNAQRRDRAAVGFLLQQRSLDGILVERVDDKGRVPPRDLPAEALTLASESGTCLTQATIFTTHLQAKRWFVFLPCESGERMQSTCSDWSALLRTPADVASMEKCQDLPDAPCRVIRTLAAGRDYTGGAGAAGLRRKALFGADFVLRFRVRTDRLRHRTASAEPLAGSGRPST